MSAYIPPTWTIQCQDHTAYKVGGFGSRQEAYEFMIGEYPNCNFDITWDMGA